ncbi:single-stranded DNA-binding protein [Streptomyces sp. NPDC001935]
MTSETIVTVTGDLVTDPEIRSLDSGTAVAHFQIASTPRIYDRRRAVDRRRTALDHLHRVRHVAQHVCESLQRGIHVIVQGRLRQRTYTDEEGIRRTAFDIEADDVGLSLRHRIAYTDRTLPAALAPSPARPPSLPDGPSRGATDA